jgi:hypothetical protein
MVAGFACYRTPNAGQNEAAKFGTNLEGKIDHKDKMTGCI